MRGIDYGEVDHFVWVTMKKDGPVIANLMLDGIYPEDLKKTVTAEDAHVRLNRKATCVAICFYRFFHPPRCPGAPPLERGAGPKMLSGRARRASGGSPSRASSASSFLTCAASRLRRMMRI